MVDLFNVRLKNALLHKNRKELITGILEEMRKGGWAPDEYTYNNILRYHAGNKDLTQCLRVLDEMRVAKVEIKEQVFDTVFDACVNDEQVQELQDYMKKMNMKVSLKAYNVRLHAAAKKGDFKRCRELMDVMTSAGVHPDVVSYNTIFQGLSKRHQMNECNGLLKEMIKKGVQPDATTYNILASGWAVHRFFPQALELVGIMRNKQVPIKHALTSIIYHMILNGEVVKGMSLFEQLIAEGNAEVETYNSVMYSLLEVGAVQACDQTRELMRQNGVLPDHVTYQALVLLATRSGHDVLALRDYMRTDHVEPNEVMLNSLLRHSKGYSTQREMELIKEMRTKGFQPEDAVLLKVMKTAASNADANACVELLADMRAHGHTITSQLYHLLVAVHVNTNNDAAVWNAVAEMRELKLGPTDATYKILLDHLERNKNWERCVELLEEMETNHIRPIGLWQP